MSASVGDLIHFDAIYDGVRKHLFIHPKEQLAQVALYLRAHFSIAQPISLWVMDMSGCRRLDLSKLVNETELKEGTVIMVAPEQYQEEDERGAVVA